MKTYTVTAQVDIEVEAPDETTAIVEAESLIGFDVVSFKSLSVDCVDEDDYDE